MIPRDPFPIKNALYKLLMFCASLLLFFGFFLGAISVWVGLSHRHHEGFWAPALAGGLLIILFAWLYVRLVLSLTRAMRRFDILRP